MLWTTGLMSLRCVWGRWRGDAGVYVADNGFGIDEEEQETVFEFGYTTNDEGAGIGLVIVQEIATAHGWTCHVTESGRGAPGSKFAAWNRIGLKCRSGPWDLPRPYCCFYSRC